MTPSFGGIGLVVSKEIWFGKKYGKERLCDKKTQKCILYRAHVDADAIVT